METNNDNQSPQPTTEPATDSVVTTPSGNLTNLTQLEPYKYEKALPKLVTAFHNGYNISEACSYAGVSRETYYNWIDTVDGFSAAMDEAKAMPNRVAKEKVVEAIKAGDTNVARWWLDRRDPEFKPKGEVDNTHSLKEIRDKIGDLLDERPTNDFGGEPATTTPSDSGGQAPTAPADIS